MHLIYRNVILGIGALTFLCSPVYAAPNVYDFDFKNQRHLCEKQKPKEYCKGFFDALSQEPNSLSYYEMESKEAENLVLKRMYCKVNRDPTVCNSQ